MYVLFLKLVSNLCNSGTIISSWQIEQSTCWSKLCQLLRLETRCNYCSLILFYLCCILLSFNPSHSTEPPFLLFWREPFELWASYWSQLSTHDDWSGSMSWSCVDQSRGFVSTPAPGHALSLLDFLFPWIYERGTKITFGGKRVTFQNVLSVLSFTVCNTL